MVSNRLDRKYFLALTGDGKHIITAHLSIIQLIIIQGKRKAVYAAVVGLVRNRLEKARAIK